MVHLQPELRYLAGSLQAVTHRGKLVMSEERCRSDLNWVSDEFAELVKFLMQMLLW